MVSSFFTTKGYLPQSLLRSWEQDWLARLPYRYQAIDLVGNPGEAHTLGEPRFVKPPNGKSFEAKVNSNGRELPEDFDDDMPVQRHCPAERRGN